MGIKEFRKEDLDALLIGLGILGTGGGGDPEWGRELIENDLARGRKHYYVDLEDIADDAFICSGGIMGSVKTFEGMSYDEIVEMWEDDFVLTKVFKEMEEITGKKLDYVIPFEAGGLNTPVIMTLAARLGIPVVNADGVGRAAPETQMASFIGHGISLYPMPLVDRYGNTIVVKKANTSTYADEIGRMVVTKGGGFGGNSHYPMTGKQLKNSCVPGCITNAIEIGKAVLSARAEGSDPVEAYINVSGGFKLFRGEVQEVAGEDKGGFYITKVRINGTGMYSASKVDMIIKNESMAVWVDGQIKVIFPDMACMLYSDSGAGVMSVDIKPGADMTIVGVPGHQRLRETMETEEGKKAFGGARYGCEDLAYIPIEELKK